MHVVVRVSHLPNLLIPNFLKNNHLKWPIFLLEMFEIVKEIHHIYSFLEGLIGPNLTLFVGHLSNVWVVHRLVEFQTVCACSLGFAAGASQIRNSKEFNDLGFCWPQQQFCIVV